jgi:hypothetical protein
MYLACTAESTLLALVCPENLKCVCLHVCCDVGKRNGIAVICQFRAQHVLGTGMEFYITDTAYFKGPCFGLITVYLQGFHNCAKHTVVIICTTCNTIKMHFSYKIRFL